ARHDAAALAATIAAVGGTLSATADLESTHVLCQVLDKDVATCLDLLPEVVAAPTFPPTEMKPVADGLVAALKRQRETPEALAGAHLANLVWGDGHVRGWPHTARAVQAVTRNDLVEWHRARFVPGNAVLAVAGDVDPDELRAALGHHFAG